jgi:hypothetical protein
VPGILIGASLGLAINKMMSFVYGIKSDGPGIYLGVAAGLGTVALMRIVCAGRCAPHRWIPIKVMRAQQ